MKGKLCMLALVWTVLLNWGPAWGDFYVISGGRSVGTCIRSLPYTISSPGFYYINRDLTSSGNGIVINADHVTIDLMGFSLIGPYWGTTKGIYFDGHGRTSGVEIRNGTVRGFEYGIAAESGYVKVTNVKALWNRENGIQLMGRNHLVKDCIASHNHGVGIYVSNGIVTGNLVSHNDSSGIHALAGTVIGNTAIDNTGTGIVAYNSTLSGNTAFRNKKEGIVAHRCTVTENTACYNDDTGIFGSGCTITGNTTQYNDNYGIGGEKSLLDRNTALNNQVNISCPDCTLGLNHSQ